MSDVDLIVVVADGAPPAQRAEIHAEVARLEIAHCFRAPELRTKSRLEKFIDRPGGNELSCFVCTRSDLLCGSAARVLGLRPQEAVFVDRIVFASMIGSAVTASGEDLIPQVPVPPIRRRDVFKALFAFFIQLVLISVTYSVLPNATRHALGVLKRSLHSCSFVYHLRPEALADEVAFFNDRMGDSETLHELLALRERYRDTRSFVLRCIPTVFKLHLRTARENRFPRTILRSG